MVKAHQLASERRAAAVIKPSNRLVLPKAAAAGGQGGGEAVIYVYEQIGVDWWTGGGCTASSMVDAIEQAKKAGATSLAIRILSEGGDAFEGLGIHEALKRCGLPTTAYNDGLCASAATMVALGCEKLIAAPTSTWMMHRALSIALGHASDMHAMAELLEKLDGTIAQVYADKSGKTAEECLALMTEEKGGPDGNWMNAEECKAAGFADEISRGGADEPDDGDEDDKENATNSAVVRLVAATERRINAFTRERLAAAGEKLSQHTRASPGTRPGQPGRTK